MASLNSVILLGNLTRDPEVRYSPSGTPVATLGLAVNNRVKQGDEWKDDPCFIDVVVFGKQAESCGGQKRSKHEVTAFRVQFMPKTGRAAGGSGVPGDFAESEPMEDDDVPF
jgi:single-strand DNA-binding protein